MVFLLELKEGFKKFYNKYDTYLVPAVRFVMALVSFLMLNASIGCIDCTGNRAFNVSAVLPFYTEAGVSFSDYGTALLDKNAVPASNCGGAVL